MHRTNTLERRAARLFVTLALVVITVICSLFLLSDTVIPEWFVIVGRWLPALLTLVVLRVVPLPGGLATWWALRPGGWRRLLLGSVVTLGILVMAYALSAAVVGATGLAQTQVWTALGQVALFGIPMVLFFSLSTLGEEAAWRGFLQRALSHLGFWRASSVVAAVWVAFHVPLHGVMALQGTIPWLIAVVTTVGLFPLGLLLSAAVARFGSVWPAVVGHALPISALNLMSDVDELSVAAHWALGGVTAVLLLAAAALLAPRGTATRTAPDREAASLPA
ncbi:CPBP family intramembrane glutamic endopeptidase [Ornithinimicrobium pratense]|uniref:CPBP family intramembrane metalloprotease n=1 Tax=Ornithinimicrobium pratense TaxID=2593973 RepID=A0A5J6V7A8_9MICO|nr:CPBP family intramembrane glutamic endopeptidase [Ornithinimicrobium pratense]QFG69036.1 CPBP family intramembrane metalloprotease [Ornithinimicrobium pratense]